LVLMDVSALPRLMSSAAVAHVVERADDHGACHQEEDLQRADPRY
jgi:hypothetical protein